MTQTAPPSQPGQIEPSTSTLSARSTIDASPVDTTSAPRAPHYPALDGLRGSALLGVLVCHYSQFFPPNTFVAGLMIGWTGVDVFFVLSGFLITGILLDAKGSPNFFRNFYARRALRIFPLYFAFVALVFLSTYLVFPAQSADTARLVRASMPSLLTFTSNYWIPAQKNWISGADIIVPLWSLSVEEQFYLLWPLVVFRFSNRALIRISLAILLGALAVRLILTPLGVSASTIYMITPTRADPLAAGGLVALLIRQPDGQRRTRRLAAYIGPLAALLLIGVSQGFDPIHHPWLRDILYTALAVFFAAFLFWTIDARSVAGVPARLYAHPALRMCGRYSYGLYLLHMPLLYAIVALFTHTKSYDQEHPTWPAATLVVTLSAAAAAILAVISFHFYERPMLSLKRYFR